MPNATLMERKRAVSLSIPSTWDFQTVCLVFRTVRLGLLSVVVFGIQNRDLAVLNLLFGRIVLGIEHCVDVAFGLRELVPAELEQLLRPRELAGQ